MGHMKKQVLQSLLKGKFLKLILIGLLGISIFFFILLIIAIIFAAKYHMQIYEFFLNAVNYIFGDTPGNVLREIINTVVNGFLRNLFV